MLANRCYYLYLRRLGSGRTPVTPIDPVVECEMVGKLVDLVTDAVPPGELRDQRCGAS